MASRREPLFKALLFAACLLPAASIVWIGLHGGLGPDPIRDLEDRTGEWTLRFLAATLAITPLRKLTKLQSLGRYRRMLGLFTFAYACIHLSMWVGVDWFFDFGAMGGEIVKHRYILVGMATFLTLVPLALTSTKASVRRLGGARWVQLHRLVYLSAVGGTVHYLWAVKKDTFYPLIYLFTFAALLGARLLWLRPKRAPRSILAGAVSQPTLQRPD